MGSIKFSLSRDARNEISDFISREFINELMKEIVNYINNEHKVEIDYTYYDEDDSESRVTIKDNGSFNVFDYMYVKDFLDELSSEGSYFQTEKAYEDSHGYRKVYMYEPKEVSKVIYDKVKANMELKKNEIYKAFKERYNDEEYLFNSVQYYKRTRDGKEYYSLDVSEFNEDKKKNLIERIKTELSNGFKSRYGSSIESKVSSIEGKFLLDVYDKGCLLLGIENKYNVDVVESDGSREEETLINLLLDNAKNAAEYSNGTNKLKVKVITSIDKRIENLINLKVYNTHEHMELFLESARKLVFGYYKSLNVRGAGRKLRAKEPEIRKILKKIAIIDNFLYQEYLRENEKAPDIYELEEFTECIPWICLKGLIWTSENVYIKNKAKNEIKDIILDNPIDEYEEARKMNRHFYLHVGETNTGKTYSSIQRLMEAESGVYLAPLRLLALEIQDRLNSENVICSLLTGEEEDIIPYASHVSSTIEKLQTGMEYDICVIDEAQMIADNQRGWAWTRAIMAVLAPEVHICMAPEALSIIIKLIEDCDDTYEIIYHKRDTELFFESSKFDLNTDVREGDALVVFGKRKALAVSAQLLNNNIKTSIIYGALPYSTRKKQFERFLNGETEVIVCTDAIGMGINLPIKRIVFLETRKFDGVSLRRLNVSEVKQIAGRAGRKGIYNKGFVSTVADENFIRGALKAKPEKIEKCFIGIPDSLLEIDIDIVDALKTWSSMQLKGFYEKTDVTRIIYLLNKLKKMNINVSNKDMLKMATIPFEENNKEVLALWEEYCKIYSLGAVNLKKPVLKKNTNSKKALDDLENYYKSLELNYSFGKNFDIIINNRFISSEKEKAANEINELLLTKLLDHERRCSMCGRKLSWDYPNDICRVCRESLNEAKAEKYKPVFRGKRRRTFFGRKNKKRR